MKQNNFSSVLLYTEYVVLKKTLHKEIKKVCQDISATFEYTEVPLIVRFYAETEQQLKYIFYNLFLSPNDQLSSKEKTIGNYYDTLLDFNKTEVK
jgi:hypothetical protein